MADRGVLIMGASGSGKTTLALTLIRQAMAEGRFARLVADDQVFLSASAGRIVAHAPAAIAGLVEVRGLGPMSASFELSAVIDLAIMLQDRDAAPRMREPGQFEFDGVGMDQLILPMRDAARSAFAVAAWFGWPPFAGVYPSN